MLPSQDKTFAGDLYHRAHNFKVGDRVHVQATCRRGCCVEMDYFGHLVQFSGNGLWYAEVRPEGCSHTNWHSTNEMTTAQE